MHAATEFDVNMILVIDHERLRVDLIRDLPDRIKILSIQKSGGVIILMIKNNFIFKACLINIIFL